MIFLLLHFISHPHPRVTSHKMSWNSASRRPADHAGFRLLLDDVDLAPYCTAYGIDVELRGDPYAAACWSNRGGDVDSWYRQRHAREMDSVTGIAYEYMIRRIEVRVSKKKFFRTMVAVGTLDGKPCNVVLSHPYQHGDHSLKFIKNLKVDEGKLEIYHVNLRIPCKVYSTKRERPL